MTKSNLWNFVQESNRIEGIVRPPTDQEVEATERFVYGARPTLEDTCALAAVYTRGKGLLRDREDMNVRVGSHAPPRGGPHIAARLRTLLATIEDANPFAFHVEFETLHPFIDGNGRSGRALWAWQMMQSEPTWVIDVGFLHSWYYQTLAAERKTERVAATTPPSTLVKQPREIAIEILEWLNFDTSLDAVNADIYGVQAIIERCLSSEQTK